MKALICLALLSGCVRNQRELARYVDTSLLASSTASIACDWGYTHRAAEDGWRGMREANPMLGSTPSTNEVSVYFISMLALNAAAWAMTPPKFRALAPLFVTTRQALAITNNNDSVGGVCGF